VVASLQGIEFFRIKHAKYFAWIATSSLDMHQDRLVASGQLSILFILDQTFNCPKMDTNRKCRSCLENTDEAGPIAWAGFHRLEFEMENLSIEMQDMVNEE
jgi:hypothetical protein